MLSCQSSQGSVGVQGNGSVALGISEDGWGESWGSGRGSILDWIGQGSQPLNTMLGHSCVQEDSAM